MAKDEYEIDVDRELELIVDVMESGVVKLRLTGGAVTEELRPGDRCVLILHPLKPDESQSQPAKTTWISDTGGAWADRAGGAAALRKKGDRGA